jgi:hypothetical protein
VLRDRSDLERAEIPDAATVGQISQIFRDLNVLGIFKVFASFETVQEGVEVVQSFFARRKRDGN